MKKIKPRTVASLIRRVLERDPKAEVHYFPKDDVNISKLQVAFSSAIVRTDLRDDIELDAVSYKSLNNRFVVIWNCDPIGEKEAKPVRAYCFDDEAQRRMDSVVKQEEDAAELVGGKRHLGSGAIEDLKSDASSDVWQIEAKQTASQSIGIKIEVLDKICREAREQDKEPLLHIRFLSFPRHIIAPDDWVMIPADTFSRKVPIDFG